MEKDLKEKIFKASLLKGDFLLRSGKTSTEYFDKYQFSAQPDLLRSVARGHDSPSPKRIRSSGGHGNGGNPHRNSPLPGNQNSPGFYQKISQKIWNLPVCRRPRH